MKEGFYKRREMERQDMAIQSLMYRRAMNEKKITLDKLLGKKQDEVSPEEHKRRFDEAVKKMGPNVIPIRKRKSN